ncbi:MAG TPA: lactate utilization protein [Candidatus Competibacteraceae bacterium]|nr:lactate utilization protein [Candidatus Competibacteraceae bacterium]
MTANARANILSRLRATTIQGQGPFIVPDAPIIAGLELSLEERIGRLQRMLETMHAEVRVVSAGGWLDEFKAMLRTRALNGLLYGPAAPFGPALEAAWEADLPPLVPYIEPAEQCRERLFSIDAGITSTRGAIAETGALILWPSAAEPRLMSLTPGLHIAVLDAKTIFNTFAEAIDQQHWLRHGMPANALLISGPSKTADIELTLTFGVHGPKELVVFILS